MTISEMLLPEFDIEMANTRRTLERVPDDKFDWAPHTKSMKLGNLAVHLAELPSWTFETIDRDELDIAPPGSTPYQPPVANNRQEVLEIFDKNVTKGRAALAAVNDEHMMKNWSLLMGGKIILKRPRLAVMRDFVLNHTIHHRAQLGVYLRLNEVPVPAIYGPSADENTM